MVNSQPLWTNGCFPNFIKYNVSNNTFKNRCGKLRFMANGVLQMHVSILLKQYVEGLVHNYSNFLYKMR